MKIFSADQIREWDQATISKESMDSIHLMERAALKCSEWIIKNISADKTFVVFCGKGNNGGDGLAIARLLLQQDRQVKSYILETPNPPSKDFSVNLKRLEKLSGDLEKIESENNFPAIPDSVIVIDAMFGYGLNRPVDGLAAALVEHINNSKAQVIAIDMPSGLFVDKSSKGNTIVRANFTLSFQIMKEAFLLGENESYIGDVRILDIGLDPDYYNQTGSRFEITEAEMIRSFHIPRRKFSHKGNFGDAALIAGSYGMMGAVVLSARACLKSGVGKITCFIPKCGYSILQTAVPEAMCSTGPHEFHHTSLGIKKQFDVYGIGPGMGQNIESLNVIEELLLVNDRPLVMDADALNLISSRKDLYHHIPRYSILTPHPKEFERLFGTTANDFERLELALKTAKAFDIFVLVKGYYSFIATPYDHGYFNSTGNPGMATAGSGDVLTGIITGLLAQGYEPEQSVLIGVYMHGLAGDIAAGEFSQEAIIAGDICNAIPDAIKKLFY